MKKSTLLFLALFMYCINTTFAQDETTLKKFSNIAQQEFSNAEEGNITYGVEAGYPYYIMCQNPDFVTNIFVNDNMEKMSIHAKTQSPGQIDMFKKKYLSVVAFKKIQQYLSKYKKSLIVGGWFANYYANGNNSKEMVSFTEFEQKGKGDNMKDKNNFKILDIYFDKLGNFLGNEKFDINKALGVVLDMTKGVDDNEGNEENINHAKESNIDLFKINTKYYIRNVKFDLYMDVYGNSVEDRGRVVLYNHTTSTNQQFEIVSMDASGKYKIQNVNSMKVLSGLPESTNIIQFESDAGERQIWEIEKVEGNHNLIRFRMLYNGKYLGVASDNAKNGTDLYEKDLSID
jgi:Ricin-type beta-trefoil lectin domain-like